MIHGFFQRPVLLAVVAGLISVLISITPQWQTIERKGYDLLTVLTAPGAADLPIVIVGIDEPSFADLGLQWPWPRNLHAELTRELVQADAAVVAFDILFADPSDPEKDKDFANAIHEAGNVVLAGDVFYQTTGLFEQVMSVNPLNQFLEAGAITGISSISVDSDLVIRNIPGAPEAYWREVVRTWQAQNPGARSANPDLPDGGMIRYLDPEPGFRYVSYYQALNAGSMLPPDTFRGKIVLVGLYVKASPEPTSSRADAFATPFLGHTGWLTPGVELQASLVANGLMDRFIRVTPLWITWVVTIASLFLAAIGIRDWRPLRSAGVIFVLIGVLVGVTYWLFGTRDTWFPAGSALVALVMLYIMQGGVAFLKETRQRKAIRSAFEHYVSPDVVAEMVADPERLKLGGNRRTLTLLFTDLEGFTAMSEDMEPEDVSEILNRHLTEMAGIVIGNGGTIDKFIGDSLMAFWGAPLDDDNQALHACETALQMQQAMKKMRQDFQKTGLPQIYMRVGIHTGPAVVGNMGSVHRFDYTAVGDAVNLASRLEGINKIYGSGILLSEDTANELGGALPMWHVDKIYVKGKARPMEIYTLAESTHHADQIENAINAYREREWDRAENEWRTLADIPAVQLLANVYLSRIRDFRNEPPPLDWDGSYAFDKM